MACLLHSFVDIVTHHDDGPVLFWPLNWHFRFPSPISYWDNAHFGRQVGIFEWILGPVTGGIPYFPLEAV